MDFRKPAVTSLGHLQGFAELFLSPPEAEYLRPTNTRRSHGNTWAQSPYGSRCSERTVERFGGGAMRTNLPSSRDFSIFLVALIVAISLFALDVGSASASHTCAAGP